MGDMGRQPVVDLAHVGYPGVVFIHQRGWSTPLRFLIALLASPPRPTLLCTDTALALNVCVCALFRCE